MRILIQLLGTAVGSVGVIAAILYTHSARLGFLLAYPAIALSGPVGALINRIFPPHGGGWFEGLQGPLIAILILSWLWIWILLMVILKLVQLFISRRKEHA